MIFYVLPIIYPTNNTCLYLTDTKISHKRLTQEKGLGNKDINQYACGILEETLCRLCLVFNRISFIIFTNFGDIL